MPYLIHVKTGKGLRFELTCKQTNQPATVAWIQAEDTRLLGQKNIFTAMTVARVWTFFAAVLQAPIPTGGQRKTGDTYTYSGLSYRRIVHLGNLYRL